MAPFDQFIMSLQQGFGMTWVLSRMSELFTLGISNNLLI